MEMETKEQQQIRSDGPRRFAGYVLVFVLGFLVCAAILRIFGSGGGSITQAGYQLRGTPGVTNKNNNQIAQAAATVEKYVVNINMEGRPVSTGLPDILGFAPRETPKGQASGVIIRKDGYIVTNNHVVADASKVWVTLWNQKQYRARVIGKDPRTDLAVVKIDANNLPAAVFANADSLRHLRVGDWTIAVGNPLGIGTTVTVGIVSATGRNVEGTTLQNAIQTDAAINRGNSGGALADINAQVIGINSVIASTSPGGGNIGIGFAIPSDLVVKIANELIAHGKVVRPWLGISYNFLDNETREGLKSQGQPVPPVNGAWVQEVVPGSPADRAGIMPQDVITTINGKKVADQRAIANEMEKVKPGQIVDLTIWHARTNQTGKIAVRTTEAPAAR